MGPCNSSPSFGCVWMIDLWKDLLMEKEVYGISLHKMFLLHVLSPQQISPQIRDLTQLTEKMVSLPCFDGMCYNCGNLH